MILNEVLNFVLVDKLMGAAVCLLMTFPVYLIITTSKEIKRNIK